MEYRGRGVKNLIFYWTSFMNSPFSLLENFSSNSVNYENIAPKTMFSTKKPRYFFSNKKIG
jgi:hypothetical protein